MSIRLHVMALESGRLVDYPFIFFSHRHDINIIILYIITRSTFNVQRITYLLEKKLSTS